MNQRLQDALSAIRELLRMFVFERVLYGISALVSFCLLIYAGWLFFNQQKIELNSIAIFFGASSVASLSSLRIAFFFNRAFSLMSELIRETDGKRP